MKTASCRTRSVRRATAVVGAPRISTWTSAAFLFAILSSTVLVPDAGAASEARDEAAPPVFDAAACYQLVSDTGRKIAWARWEIGAPEDNVVVRFDDDTPEWIVDLTQRWIEDAYHWQATDDQVRQLGAAGALSPSQELTTPQTIALWLRRIALQCSEQHT